MSARDLDRLLLLGMVGLLLRALVLVVAQLREAEAGRRELRSRVGHGAPVWRRQDHDWFGARW